MAPYRLQLRCRDVNGTWVKISDARFLRVGQGLPTVLGQASCGKKSKKEILGPPDTVGRETHRVANMDESETTRAQYTYGSSTARGFGWKW